MSSAAAFLRSFTKDDPVRYDFALTPLGRGRDGSEEAFLAWPWGFLEQPQTR